MVCLGKHVHTADDFTLHVPDSRFRDLSDELHLWLSRKHFTIKELQSWLGKLSFVTACFHSSRIFPSLLLNALRSFPSSAYVEHRPVSPEMRKDLAWWHTLLPYFNGVSVMKPADWLLTNLPFTTDACMFRGGATCRKQCLTFSFPDIVFSAASHIFVIEFFTVAVAVKFWTPFVQHQRFLVSCDNEAAVTVINSGSPKDPFMQRCLGQLWLISTLHDFEMHAHHSPGVSAFISLTYRRFCSFLSTTISAIGLVPAHYSAHSFQRSGASFAFRCNFSAQLIQRQGDWQTDAYQLYL